MSAISSDAAGLNAATVAIIEVWIGKSCQEYSGPITLQQFATAPLFRLAIQHNNSNRNKAVLCFPADAVWEVKKASKQKSSRSGVKVLKFEIVLPEGGPEGFDKLAFTIPFDGDNGDKACLFHSACTHACAFVFDTVQQERRSNAAAAPP